MHRAVTTLALVGLLALSLAPASGFSEPPVPLLQSESNQAAACAPPCGYIVPEIRLDFPTRVDCRNGEVLGQESDASLCQEMPAVGESVSHEGTLIWTWDVSDQGWYPTQDAESLFLEFLAVGSNPDWMQLTVEAPRNEISAADLANPTNYQTQENPNSEVPQTWFRMEFPMTVTITRTGEATGEELEEWEETNRVPVFMRAKSTASGETYREGWTVAVFDFQNPHYQEASTTEVRLNWGAISGVAIGAVLVIVAVVVVILKRR